MQVRPQEQTAVEVLILWLSTWTSTKPADLRSNGNRLMVLQSRQRAKICYISYFRNVSQK